MKWLDRLFGKQKSDSTDKSPYLPNEKLSKDIGFAQNFTEKGGFFLYNESQKNVLANFKEILKENFWDSEDILCFDSHLSTVFNLPLKTANDDIKNCKAGLFLCEYLISNTGAILFCNRQMHHFKVNQLPQTLIVYASSNQFVSDVSEGMTLLKNKYTNNIPTNISAIDCQDAKESLTTNSAPSPSKNIYLLLQDH